MTGVSNFLDLSRAKCTANNNDGTVRSSCFCVMSKLRRKLRTRRITVTVTVNNNCLQLQLIRLTVNRPIHFT